ncbi:MAG: CotH kinase family protein [Oscillospiraceae bacterium]|nr:CotH kinase family protein [Oscillospiraceae bacterium]
MRDIRKRIAAVFVLCSMVAAAMTGCADSSADSADAGTNGTGETASQTVQAEETSAAENNEQAETEAPAEEEKEETQEALPPSAELSHKSGVYAEGFSLEITALEEGEIYYTTDGSDPALSDTAVLYSGPVSIASRKGDANVVSAVDPVLFSGNFSEVNDAGNGFTSKIAPPSDEAVDKCTVIRAAVKKPDGTFGGDTFSTYFIGTAEEHIQGLKESCEASGTSLAVMSISMNYDDLFDSEKGIYVKGDIFDKELQKFVMLETLRDPETARSLDANYKQKGKEWEREAVVSLMEFTPDGAEEVISQGCGIRIQGNYSRSDLLKGFRLYAKKEYGENNFDYAVFGNDYLNAQGEVMDKFDTLTLRNGGNCAFTAKFNDTYWQSLVEDMACSTQKSRPCVVYLNGEYWGLYLLQEDYTNDYMEDYYGVDKKDVVIYKGDAEALKLGYKLDEGDLPDGITDETYYFSDLFRFFKTHNDLKSEEDYNEFVKLVDPDSVMDYFAVQCWIDNKWDWPGKNWSMWRTIEEDRTNPYADKRWRLMFYDIEFGGVCGEGDIRNNTIKNANYKQNGLLDMDTNNPAVLCFAYLMTNDNFKAEFCNKLAGLSETNFEQTRALERLKEFESIYSPLFDQFFARYEGAGTTEEAVEGGYASIKCIRDFLSDRENNIQKQIDFVEKVLG